MYLTLRHRVWWAFHDVPPSLRSVIGKRRFHENLRTRDHGRAKIRGAMCEAQWLAEIERARQGNSLEAEAAFWRKRLTAAKSEPERQAVREQIDAGTDLIHLMSPREADAADIQAKQERFRGLATGALIPFGEHLDEHLALVGPAIEAKSLHMKKTNLLRFAASFVYTADVERSAVQTWLNGQAKDGMARATLARAVGDLKGYWRHLVAVGSAKGAPDPFAGLVMAGVKRKRKSEFAPADMVRLLAGARKRKDGELADLVDVARWTGARIEELCSLEIPQVHLPAKLPHFAINEGKTDAALREVPIHAAALATFKRLLGSRTSGYVFEGLTPNKFGDRSNAIGKRFGRLKAEMGFGEECDFHSIRRGVCTMFENAGVPENVVAGIIGHKHKTLTYGLYSGGPALVTKATAMRKLRYPAK